MDKQKKELEATLPEETTMKPLIMAEALKELHLIQVSYSRPTNSSTVSTAFKSALRDLAASLNTEIGYRRKISDSHG